MEDYRRSVACAKHSRGSLQFTW